MLHAIRRFLQIQIADARDVTTLDALEDRSVDVIIDFYPEPLKRRIRGAGGHLSTIEAAELLRTSAGTRLKWICLGHLSEENNNPELALQTHREMLGNRVPLFVAGRDAATDVIEL